MIHVITAGRLNEYNVIHSGLRLTNLYMFFTMGSAVAVAMPILFILGRRGWISRRGTLDPQAPVRLLVGTARPLLPLRQSEL